MISNSNWRTVFGLNVEWFSMLHSRLNRAAVSSFEAAVYCKSRASLLSIAILMTLSIQGNRMRAQTRGIVSNDDSEDWGVEWPSVENQTCGSEKLYSPWCLFMPFSHRNFAFLPKDWQRSWTWIFSTWKRTPRTVSLICAEFVLAG